MGNSLRLCLACVLPCGALDLVRVVHINGRVDQFTHPLPAASVLAAYPRHVLTKVSPESPSGAVIVPPEADLRRGHIYFLVPDPSLQEKIAAAYKRRTAWEGPSVASGSAVAEVVEKVAPERRATHRRRRSGRVGVGRQQLECIVEDD